MVKQDNKKSWKDGWEYKSAKMVLRIIAVLFVVGYVLATWRLSLQWFHMEMARQEPLSHIVEIAKESIDRKSPSMLANWISYRDQRTEGLQIIEYLTPYAGEIGSPNFFTFSKIALYHGQNEDAIFWYEYTRFRLYFDSLRCGLKEGSKLMQGILDLFYDERLIKITPKDKKEYKKILERVMDFDAQYPANNYPVDVCPMLAKLNGRDKSNILDKKQWPRLRHDVRILTEKSLAKMGAAE